ncbi:MAG TPA: hypothetical protein VMM13_21005 [Euzebya sp.]|nr:hypothetical protein [Euzebya sp.]
MVLKTSAALLRDVLTANDHADCFLGHSGGDDFVMVVPADLIDDVCKAAVTSFDRMIPTMYAEEDLRRGYIEVQDRRGEPRHFGMVSMAIGVTSNLHRDFDDHRHMVLVATEMKSHVKQLGNDTSSYAVDGRTV